MREDLLESLAGAREGFGPVVPADAGGARRPGPERCRHGGLLRGAQLLALRPGGVQLRRARRRQHDGAGEGRHRGAEGALAAADRRGTRALGLRHDRAPPGRRLRSLDDPHHGDAPRRRLADRRPQVVHHRRRHRAPFHPRRQDLGRSAQGPHRVPVRSRPARLADRAAHPDHGTRGAWRPLRARVRRARDPGRQPADGRGRRTEGHADPPGHRAPHPLHALARPRAPLARHRRRLRGRARKPGQARSPSAKACR